MATINQLSTANTFVDWLTATTNLITVANNLIDGTFTSNSQIILTTPADKFSLNIANTASINVLYANVATVNTRLNVSGSGVTLNVANDMHVMGNSNVYGKLIVNDFEVTGAYTLSTPSFTNLYLPEWLKTDANVNVGTNLIVGTYIDQRGANSSFAGNVFFSNTTTSFYAMGNAVFNKGVRVTGNTTLTGDFKVATPIPVFDGNVVILNTTTSIYALGNISTLKNISAGNVAVTNNVTTGNITITYDINAGRNVIVTNNLSTGNVSTTYDIASGRDVTVTKNLSAGNISTTYDITSGRNVIVTKNLSTGNVSTTYDIASGRDVTVTKNLSAGNISVAYDISATRNVTSGNLIVQNIILTNDIYTSTGDLYSTSSQTPKNFIDNSRMEINQNTGVYVQLSSSREIARTVDRWVANCNTATAVVRLYRSTDNPTPRGLSYSLNVDVQTACTSTTATTFDITQGIEGYNSRQLEQQDFIISFWVKSSNTGTYCVSLRNFDKSESYVSTYSITAVNTWQEKSIIVTGGIASGVSTNRTSGLGLLVGFTLKGTTGKNAPSLNTWLTGDYMSASGQVNILNNTTNYFYISGVRLHLGTTYYPYVSPDITDDWERCRRFYQTSYAETDTVGEATEVGCKTHYIPTTTMVAGKNELWGLNWQLYPPMRTTPTVLFWNTQTANRANYVWNIESAVEIAVDSVLYANHVSTGWPYISGSPTEDRRYYAHFTADAEFYI